MDVIQKQLLEAVAGPLGCASELIDIDIEKLKNMKILFVGGV